MTLCSTAGTVYLFGFAPGDDTQYRVLFGRLPSPSLYVRTIIVFGFAEGFDTLITMVFDTDDINEETCSRHWNGATSLQAAGDPAYIEAAAYTVFCALTGQVEEQRPRDRGAPRSSTR